MGINDGNQWWESMMGINDGNQWWESMMGINDGNQWWKSMMGINDGLETWEPSHWQWHPIPWTSGGWTRTVWSRSSCRFRPPPQLYRIPRSCWWDTYDTGAGSLLCIYLDDRLRSARSWGRIKRYPPTWSQAWLKRFETLETATRWRWLSFVGIESARDDIAKVDGLTQPVSNQRCFISALWTVENDRS